jgi:hypothetical protein
MLIGLSNKDGRIFFIKLLLYTFPDKEAHKCIIYEYILKLEITESNNMEGFQRELQRQIKQYDAIQVSEWKRITTHIIRQYQKIDSQPLQTGFNMQVVTGPSKAQNKYGWLCTLLEWTNITHHNLITRNLWPKPETTNKQELNTMPMHEIKMGCREQLLEHHQIYSKGEDLARFINKTNSTKINTYRYNSRSIQYQLRSIPINACLYKSKS